MRKSRRLLAILEIIIIIFASAIEYSNRKSNAQTSWLRQRPIKVDVLLYNSNDIFVSLVRQNLEEIQRQNEGKVEFEFFDGKGNQAVQNEFINEIINRKVDILLINLVETRSAKDVIDKIRSKNIPIIFFNREPVPIESIKSYDKAYYIGTHPGEAGTLQGKSIVNFWNNNREIIDKNKDNILQYIVLKGEHNNLESIERTNSSISTIKNAGISTDELAVKVGNWDKDLARASVESMFLNFGNKIEAVISNNDAMAIGAIEALQKYGFNKGDKSKYIAVFGIDALPEAQELIKQGVMTSTVVQDPSEMAKAAYTIGINVFQGNQPLYNTLYEFDETGVAVRIPYKEYVG